jgi:hypothetical protein
MTLPREKSNSKQIWVAAIDLEPAPGTDGSHPAFYLPGQELDSGNTRAFSVLEPCHEDGAMCSTGIDCCGGFCTAGQCGKSTTTCSALEDRCATNADCCTGKGLRCLGGFCGRFIP